MNYILPFKILLGFKITIVSGLARIYASTSLRVLEKKHGKTAIFFICFCFLVFVFAFVSISVWHRYSTCFPLVAVDSSSNLIDVWLSEKISYFLTFFNQAM